MKYINQKTLIGLTILALFLISNGFWYQYTKTVEAELTEAKKPSLVEVQHSELKNLEKTWQELEKSCQKKPNVEEKIRNKRSEILGK